jgi:hypothetical protein
MLRGAAGSLWQALKMRGNFCNMRDMKMAGFVPAKRARSTD